MQLGNLLEEDARTGQLRLIVPNASSRSAEGSVGEGAAVRRGVIRFLVVVIDASESMNQRDMRPSRIGVASQVVSTFIDNFFDQNPISQLALVELRQGKAEKITELSGNARHHRGRLEERVVASRGVGGGQASIRAGLEIAAQMLEMQASYGTREVLLVYGSLSSVDNGDIFETVRRSGYLKWPESSSGQ
ncbi:Ssl1-like-domain-containing protein [Baffinella frigidus]|nr:Ssl1-like-domain-containing protein [Cryptophyta sp. CCMP2293]